MISAPRGTGGGPVAVALGSNLGDRGENLRYGLRELERRLAGMRTSGVYRSRPREGAEGGTFLNMCVAGRAAGAGDTGPAGLLRELQYVEMGAGRSPRRRPGRARTLDLDLLLFGDRTVRAEELRVPHPRMAERNFVLRPLAELLPDWRHPGTGRSVRELAERAGTSGLERVDARGLA